MDFFLGNSYKAIDLETVLNLITPLSPYGERVKKKITPTKSVTVLRREYDRVYSLLKIIEKHSAELSILKDHFSNLKDIVPILKKVKKDLVLDDKDFFYLKKWLFAVRDIEKITKKTGILKVTKFKLTTLEGLVKVLSLDNEGPSFYLSEKHNMALGEARIKLRKTKSELDQYLENVKQTVEKKHQVKFNIENSLKVTKFDIEKIKNLSESDEIYYYGETYSHVEFKLKLSEEMLILNKEIDELKHQVEIEENKVREYLTREIFTHLSNLEGTCQVLGKLDWLITKSFYSKEIKGKVPTIVHDNVIIVKEARNPVLETILARRGKQMTPIDIEVRRGVTVITGSNMGGKSVTLKSIGLIVAMAQLGFLVPCQSLEFAPRDFIYFSQDEGQSIQDGLSTFGMEVRGIKRVLPLRTKEGLYLIDELARGTNPVEGGALALSIAHYLNKGNCITFMATHFEDLICDNFNQLRIVGLDNLSQKRLRQVLKGRKGLDAVEELMDFRVKSVTELGLPREGLKIAALMGIPREIIKKADEIISTEGRHKNEQIKS